MSITIPTGDLVGLLGDTIPFAFTDAVLPELHAVRVEWDGETLHFLASDRYRVAWSQWVPGDVADGEEVQDDMFTSWGSGDEPWATTIDLDDAVELAKVFKLPRKEMQTPLTLDYDAARDQTKVIRSRETGHSAITVVAVGNGTVYPDVRAMLAKADRVTATRSVAYRAEFLADFAKVRARGPLELTFAKTLTHVVIGNRFIGAIAPAGRGED